MIGSFDGAPHLSQNAAYEATRSNSFSHCVLQRDSGGRGGRGLYIEGEWGLVFNGDESLLGSKGKLVVRQERLVWCFTLHTDGG